MRKFNEIAAQGDLLIIKCDEIPSGIDEVQPQNGKHVVAHSETGHHHTLSADRVRYFRPDEASLGAYIEVKEPTPLVHEKSFDVHESIMLEAGVYQIRRAREYTPEGYRVVQD